MRLWLDPEVEDFRAELNTFLDEHAPPEMLRGFDTMDTGAEDRASSQEEGSPAVLAVVHGDLSL